MIPFIGTILLWAGVTITLPAETKVSGTELSLGAVASVECDDPELAKRLSGLALGYAPAPGYSRVLDAAAIQRQARALAPGVEIRLAGARTCRVSPLTEVIASEAIVAAARAALAQQLAAQRFEDCTFELVGEQAPIEVPKGKGPCTLEVAPANPKSKALPSAIAVRLIVDGQTYRTAHTAWKVQAWREQPVLVRAVRAGESIEPSMIELRRTAVDLSLAASSLEPGQVLGTVAAREIAAGSVLFDGDLVRPTLVRKGDSVMLLVDSGAVRVRTPAVAEQSGAKGDRIKVVVQQTGRELSVIVESKDSVRLSLGGRSAQGESR